MYAYNNTVQSSTGYTPRFLLFGWNPIDIRVPLAFQTDVDSFLSSRSCYIRFSYICVLECARKSMNTRRNAVPNTHVYNLDHVIQMPQL